MTNILIYQNQDINDLPLIIRDRFLTNMSQFRKKKVKIEIEKLMGEISSAIWLFLVDGNILIGSLRFFLVKDSNFGKHLSKYYPVDYSFYINAVVISPNYRGQGYVQLLLSKVKEITSGAKLFLEVDSNNSNAIRAYEKAHFKKLSRYMMYEYDTILMVFDK